MCVPVLVHWQKRCAAKMTVLGSVTGSGIQSRTASHALHGSPLWASPSANEAPLQPLPCSFSHSPAASTPVTQNSMPYRLHNSLSSLAALSVAGSSPTQSPPMNPGKALFEVQVNGARQASAEQPGFSNGSPPNKAVPAAGFGSDAAFASAEPQPFATSGANSGSSPQDRAGQGGVLPWVEVDSVQASPKIRHTDSWTEWTLGEPALEAQRACNLQQNPLVSLLDL